MSENKNIAWFRNAKYGVFIHFGIYSVLEGSYHGERSGNYAEWIWSKLKVPNREVERIAKTAFQPMYFDAEEWVRFAKECGMEYIILTAKHHEGFALYHSKADPYNVVDFTPFGRDILAELAAACRKYQLRLGIYYSQDLDWHEEHGGGYTWNHIPCEGVSFSNTWDFGWDSSDKNYDICFRKKILPQVKELMTGYGDISLVWFDVPATINPVQSRELYDTVKALQPDCLVSSRIGNGMYDFYSFDDNEIPNTISATVLEENNRDGSNGLTPAHTGLFESACTLQNSWGYCAWDTNWKSPETILRNKQKLNSLGINYTINIGPDHLGRFPVQALETLRAVRQLEGAQN